MKVIFQCIDDPNADIIANAREGFTLELDVVPTQDDEFTILRELLPAENHNSDFYWEFFDTRIEYVSLKVLQVNHLYDKQGHVVVLHYEVSNAHFHKEFLGLDYETLAEEKNG